MKTFDFVVRAHYDAKRDLINLTVDPKLHPEMAAQGFRVSLRKDTPSESILRKELERTGVISVPNANRPAVQFEDWLHSRTMTEKQLKLLKLLLDSKRNIFIYGGVGSGKTWLVSAMLNYLEQQGVDSIYYTAPDGESPLLHSDSHVTQLKLPYVHEVNDKQLAKRVEGFDRILRTLVRAQPNVIALEQTQPAQLDVLNELQAAGYAVIATANGRAVPTELAGAERIFSAEFQERLTEGFYGAVIYLHERRNDTAMTIELL